MKCLQHDPRFKILGKVSERKQVFNAWKIQRSKDERVSYPLITLPPITTSIHCELY